MENSDNLKISTRTLNLLIIYQYVLTSKTKLVLIYLVEDYRIISGIFIWEPPKYGVETINVQYFNLNFCSNDVGIELLIFRNGSNTAEP